jgi:NitT/TauT family transport system ATP-binding protein
MQVSSIQSDAFLRVAHVGKTYQARSRSVEALSDVSFDLAQGSVLAIVGKSGCGKSTLLRILAGLLTPSIGSVTIKAQPVKAYRQSQGIGFVFQKPTLFPWRTLLDNVLLPAEIAATQPKSASRLQAQELIQRLGLAGFEQALPHQLSGGMQQRGAIARALMGSPQLLLLDEPFSALDEPTRESLWLDFHRIWQQQKISIILVTHSIREAVFFADRVLVLAAQPGRVIADVPIELGRARDYDTLASPSFVRQCEDIRRLLS